MSLLPPHGQGEPTLPACLHPFAMASAPTASQHAQPAAATAGSAPARPANLHPPAAPTSTAATVDGSRLSEQDDAVILQSLRAHLWSHGGLPRGADLVAVFFGRLSRTDYSLGDVEAKIRALRRRFREADAALCAGTGCPAPGHGLRMYALSLEVWGATPAVVAPPRRDPVPDKDAASSATAAVGNRMPVTPVPRAAADAAPAPAKKRRCEEYPALAREAERLTREALERIDDVTAWSLEIRASKKEQRRLQRMRKHYLQQQQQQQRAGGVPAGGRAEGGSKELASVVVKLLRGKPVPLLGREPAEMKQL